MQSRKLSRPSLCSHQFQTGSRKSRTVIQNKNDILIFKDYNLNTCWNFRIKHILSFLTWRLSQWWGERPALSGDASLQNHFNIVSSAQEIISHVQLTCYKAYGGTVTTAQFWVSPRHHGNSEVVVPCWQQISYPLKRARRQKTKGENHIFHI